jgi:hypothetical protein
LLSLFASVKTLKESSPFGFRTDFLIVLEFRSVFVETRVLALPFGHPFILEGVP